MENETNSLQVNNEEEGLSLKDILHIVKRHIIAIVIFVVAFAALGFVYGKMQAPKYTSSTSLYVEYREDSNVGVTSQYTLSRYITETYVVFLTNDVVMDNAASKLASKGIEILPKQIKSNLTVSSSSDALVINMKYVASDPSDAKIILNTIVDSLMEVTSQVETKIDPITNQEVTQYKYTLLYNNIKKIGEAKDGVKSTSTMKNTLIFFAIGLVAAFVYVLLRELFDTRFKSFDEVEKTLGVPVLTGIIDYEMKEGNDNEK